MSSDHPHHFPGSTGGQQHSSASHWDPQTQSSHPYGSVSGSIDSLGYPQEELSPHDTTNLHIGASGPSSLSDAAFIHHQEFMTSPVSPPNGASAPSPLSSSAYYGILDPLATGNEEIISAAIEEDKRRRNTAASARFRLKKKEREAELERSTKEMSERCEELQRRISALETENRWLRELITERSRNRGRRRVDRSPDGRKKRQDGEEDAERIIDQRRGMRLRK